MEEAKEETKKPKLINVDDTNYLIYHQFPKVHLDKFTW